MTLARVAKAAYASQTFIRYPLSGGTLIIRLVLAFVITSPASLLYGQSMAAAVLPLPMQLRDGATIVRLDSSLQPEVLRQGTNGIVCIADAPNDDDFDE